MSHVSHRLVLRGAIALSGLALVSGCVGGFNLPRRRPGSNVTLPQTTESLVLQALLPCELRQDTRDRARALVDCDQTLLNPTPVGDPQRAGPARTP